VGGTFVLLRVAFPHAARSQIRLDADDRLDPRAGGGVVEIDHAEHGAVIGQGQGRHAHLLGTLHDLLDIAEPV
jgi:hypothetical protein